MVDEDDSDFVEDKGVALDEQTPLPSPKKPKKIGLKGLGCRGKTCFVVSDGVQMRVLNGRQKAPPVRLSQKANNI